MPVDAERVLVLDGAYASAVAMARGLRDAGYDVAVAAARRSAAGLWVRGTRRLIVPSPYDGAARFVAAVRDAALREHASVVCACVEASTMALARHRAQLPEPLQRLVPDYDVFIRAAAKDTMLQAAAAVGLEPPATIVCGSGSERRAAAASLGLPVIVKPVLSTVWLDDDRLAHAGNPIVIDDEASMDAVAPGPVIVQRFHPHAPVLGIAGVIDQAGLAALVAQRSVRTWPQRAGSVSEAVTVTPAAGLVSGCVALLNQLGWRGMFHIDLLEQPSGSIAAVDVNPRPYTSLELALRSGVNLPAAWLESPPVSRRPLVAKSGVRYRRGVAEAAHAVRHARGGELGAAAAILRPSRRIAWPFFRLSDPAPIAARTVEAGAARASRLLRVSRLFSRESRS